MNQTFSRSIDFRLKKSFRLYSCYVETGCALVALLKNDLAYNPAHQCSARTNQ